jgi:hypothetical protein
VGQQSKDKDKKREKIEHIWTHVLYMSKYMTLLNVPAQGRQIYAIFLSYLQDKQFWGKNFVHLTRILKYFFYLKNYYNVSASRLNSSPGLCIKKIFSPWIYLHLIAMFGHCTCNYIFCSTRFQVVYKKLFHIYLYLCVCISYRVFFPYCRSTMHKVLW